MSAVLAILIRALITCAAAYAGVCLYVFLNQRSMLYHPQTLREDEMETLARSSGMERWISPSGARIGWSTKDGEPGQPVLILHGNAGHALNREPLVALLRQAGARGKIHIPDYPGYGPAAGSPDQAGLVATAVAALDALPARAVIVGESLGTGIASQAAARRPAKVQGLVLITPFDSMVSAASHHYPWLPVGLLLRDRFDSVAALKNLQAPVAVIIGGQDTTTPPDGGKRLHASLAGPARLSIVPGAGHNDAAASLPAAEWQSIWQFVTQGW